MANVYFEKECITVDDGVFGEFSRRFKEINAGGGLVRNTDGKYLVIFRRGMWDLPKGKQEEGESIEECALREVEEETGLGNLTLGKLICVTHHTYKLNGEPVLKHTYWFDMAYAGNEKPVPQEEEQISEVRWVGKEQMPEIARETYPSIVEVLTSIEGL